MLMRKHWQPTTVQQKLFIPKAVRHLRVSELPTTKRLDSALQALGVQKLGDLAGRNVDELLKQEHCGVRTILALQQLIEPAVCREFDHRRTHKKNPAYGLLNLIEAAIERLPNPDRQLLLGRFGAASVSRGRERKAMRPANVIATTIPLTAMATNQPRRFGADRADQSE